MSLSPLAADAAEVTLTLQEALALARERGSVAIAARGRVEEAKGKEAGAGVLLRENPEIEGLAGTRRASSEATTDFEIGVGQTFELGGRRGARLRAARAGVDGARADAEKALRVGDREVKIAFSRVVHADERIALAQSADGLAAGLLATVERRHRAGDIADLDVNLARVAAARARADLREAEALRAAAAGELKALLGLGADTDLRAKGDLRARARYARADLLAKAADRADLRSLAAEAREGRAEAELGKGYGWPDLGIRVEYHEEGDEQILLGGLTIRLPLFERGQELRQTGRARERRARAESAALRDVIATQVDAALEVHAKRVEAAEEYEKNALVALDDSQALAAKSYEAGEIGVAEYLRLRRDLLDARQDYLDRLLEIAMAGADVEARAGVSP